VKRNRLCLRLVASAIAFFPLAGCGGLGAHPAARAGRSAPLSPAASTGTSPSAYPSGLTGKCRIDVRATGFAYGYLGRFGNHLWVVYTDMTGAQYHFESLPNPYPWNPFHQGDIKIYQGTDAKSKVGPMKVIHAHCSLCQIYLERRRAYMKDGLFRERM
jgi:hypothetical protein